MMPSANDKKTTVLILSLPGVLQNVIQNAFTARTDNEVIGIANGGLSALVMIKKHQPDLVVIDSNLPQSEVVELIHYMKGEASKTRFMALADSRQQASSLKSAGADFVLYSMDFPAKISAVYEQLNLAVDEPPEPELS